MTVKSIKLGGLAGQFLGKNSGVTDDIDWITISKDYEVYNITQHDGFDAAIASGNVADIIEDAAAAAFIAGKRLVLPKHVDEYPIIRTTVIPSGVDVEAFSPIVYYGSTEEPAIEVGDPAELNLDRFFKLEVHRNTQSDWSNLDCIGILFHNIYSSELHIDGAKRFTIGLQIHGSDAGYGHGSPYNIIRLGNISDNRYGVNLHTSFVTPNLVDGGAGYGGYVNENLFLNGRFSVFSGTKNLIADPVNTPPCGFAHTGTGRPQNANLFIKPSIEIYGGNTPFDEVYPWFTEVGLISNKMLNARHENNSSHLTFLRIEGAGPVRGNVAELSYTVNITQPIYKYISDPGGIGAANIVAPLYVRNVEAPYSASSWESGPLAEKAVQYDSTGKIYIPGLHAITLSGNYKGLMSSNTGNLIGADYVELEASSGSGFGVLVDTQETKILNVKCHCVAGYENIRTSIRCWAADKVTQLTGTSPYYAALDGASYTTNLGGTYQTGSNSAQALCVRLHEDVKYIEVLFWQLNPTGGPATARIKSININSLDATALVCGSWYTGYDDHTRLAEDEPTGTWKGNHHNGAIIFNTDVSSASSPLGWRFLSGTTYVPLHSPQYTPNSLGIGWSDIQFTRIGDGQLGFSPIWNSSGTAFHAWRVNITDTASHLNSKVFDWQFSTNSIFGLSKGGEMNLGLANRPGSIVITDASGVETINIDSEFGVMLGSEMELTWSSTTGYSNYNVRLIREGAGILAQRNLTGAQTYRLYKTYTDDSNYERAEFTWEANTLLIRNVPLGTGVFRPIEFYGSSVYSSGKARTGSNTAFGLGALENTTVGGNNTSFGYYSLNGTSTGTGCTSMGATALFVNTGSTNTAFGWSALLDNTTGSNNTAVGGLALENNTDGFTNIGVGRSALPNNTTGDENIAIGNFSGRFHADGVTDLTTPNNSIYIGHNVRGNNNSDSNSIVIGNAAIGLGANSTVIGVSSTTLTKVFGKLQTSGDSVQIDTAKTPSSAADTGVTGQIAWDANFIYVCTATNTWKRVAIATW